jgi:hypothetical protein
MGQEVFLFLAVSNGNTSQSLHGWVIFVRIRILETPLLKIGIPVIYRCSCRGCLNNCVAQSIRSSSFTLSVKSSILGGDVYIFCFRCVFNKVRFFLNFITHLKVNPITFNFKILLHMSSPFHHQISRLYHSSLKDINVYDRKGGSIKPTLADKKDSTFCCFVLGRT